MALSKREVRIAGEYARLLKLEDKAKACYDRVRQRTRKLALRILKTKEKRVKINEEGKYLIAEDQFSAAIKTDNAGDDSALWAHGAVRRWKLVTRNLD